MNFIKGKKYLKLNMSAMKHVTLSVARRFVGVCASHNGGGGICFAASR
jgi:hypothetical protein